MIELQHNRLVFSFPQVHEAAQCTIDFQRTLRIPDDNRDYPLPPGLNKFPLQHVEDHAKRLPEKWQQHGGVLLPMYQSEAMWLNFGAGRGHHELRYPFAIKIAAGKINAVTGAGWDNALQREPQDYVVLPEQPWLDGFCVQKGLIRQFVAMPLGAGYSAEEQLTGAAEHGGLQIIAYPMKRERYEAMVQEHENQPMFQRCMDSVMHCEEVSDSAMGLAPGGLMRQNIHEDEYGFDAWDTSQASRCFVHILNSEQWQHATGQPVPGKPPTAADYSNAGLPWFEHYDDTQKPLAGSGKLAGLHSVAAMGVQQGEKPLSDNEPVSPQQVVKLGPKSTQVKQGWW